MFENIMLGILRFCFVVLIILSIVVCIIDFLPSEKVNEKIEVSDISNNRIGIWVDEETGVNYIIYSSAYKGGITQRLNADGTVYVSGE